MNRLNTIIRRSLVYLAPAGFVIYLRIPTLYAKDAKDAKEDVKKAARDACKKAFKCLLADHSDCDQDAKTVVCLRQLRMLVSVSSLFVRPLIRIA